MRKPTEAEITFRMVEMSERGACYDDGRNLFGKDIFSSMTEAATHGVAMDIYNAECDAFRQSAMNKLERVKEELRIPSYVGAGRDLARWCVGNVLVENNDANGRNALGLAEIVLADNDSLPIN